MGIWLFQRVPPFGFPLENVPCTKAVNLPFTWLAIVGVHLLLNTKEFTWGARYGSLVLVIYGLLYRNQWAITRTLHAPQFICCHEILWNENGPSINTWRKLFLYKKLKLKLYYIIFLIFMWRIFFKRKFSAQYSLILKKWPKIELFWVKNLHVPIHS